MADSNANMTQSTPQEIIISVIAGLLAPLLAIFLVVQLIRGIQEKQVDVDTSEVANKTIGARIKPFATLVALDANAPRVEQSGEQVFTAACTSCHTPGALGAPKFNSKSDWAARLGLGFDTLTKHAIEGIRAMPARGGNPDLSDIEVARAVAYMANSAGASFKEPAAEAPVTTPAPSANAAATSAPSAAASIAAPGATASPTTPPGAQTQPAAPAPVVTAAKSVASDPAPAAAKPAEPAVKPATPAAPKPIAASPATPPAVATDSGKGEAIYKQNCAVCHAAGVAGATKLTDKAAWGPRIAKGMAAMYASALKGKGAMPAKGGNPSLTDADVKAAVDYMVGQAK